MVLPQAWPGGETFPQGFTALMHHVSYARYRPYSRYAAYTEGAHGIKPGDFALFHGHYALALSRNFDIGAEAYCRIEQQSYVHGAGRRDGFTEVCAGPKIQIKVPEAAYLMVGAAVFFPVYRDYDSMRLSTDTRYEFSVLVAF